jgi:hypothetical protein
MADDTAHVTPGPPPDPITGDANAGAPQGGLTTGDSAQAALPPSVAEHAEPVGADIDIIGRSAAPVAAIGYEEPVAVLAGAASAARSDQSAAVGVVIAGAPAESPTRTGSGFVTREDLPTWTFRDPGSRPSTVAAPADRAQVELPFTPADELAAPPPRPQPMFGPVGRPRSTLLVPLLAVASLGVSALVWHHRANRQLEEFDPKLHVRPGRSAVAVAVPWLVGLLITVAGAALLITARMSIHIPFDTHLTTAQGYLLLAGLVAVPYLTLVLPFSVVAVVMTLERIRCVEEHLGITTDRQVRPVGTALLLAIPIVGGLILLGVEQGRINAIWAAVTPAGFVRS